MPMNTPTAPPLPAAILRQADAAGLLAMLATPQGSGKEAAWAAYTDAFRQVANRWRAGPGADRGLTG